MGPQTQLLLLAKPSENPLDRPLVDVATARESASIDDSLDPAHRQLNVLLSFRCETLAIILQMACDRKLGLSQHLLCGRIDQSAPSQQGIGFKTGGQQFCEALV